MARSSRGSATKELFDFNVDIDNAGNNADIQIRTGEEFVELRTANISLSIAIDDRGKIRAYVFDTDKQKIMYHQPL